MSEAVIVALITAGVSLAGTILTVVLTNKHTLSELDKKSEVNDVKLEEKLRAFQAVTDTKLDELTREVREHNNFAKRMPALEVKVDRLEKEMDKK